MKNIARLNVIVPALFISLALATSAFAQSASTSMHEAGESTENAASSAGHAVSHAYHGTATAVTDSAATAKVKTSLHDDKVTKDSTIHVTTVAGVVTLRGTVASSSISDHAEEIAKGTSGVKGVRNKLKISSGSAAN